MVCQEILDKINAGFWGIFAPPPDLTVSQWADEYLVLSPEDSAEPGKFSVDRAPYQRGMMDAVSDPTIRDVVFCTSSQIGKSQMAKCILGYHVHQDPGPLLVIQPTTEMAEAFSKDRLAPMVRDTPVLTSKIADPKSRSSGNSILHKNFAGGQLTLIGANSPAGLASRPIRIVFADEVDRYPTSAGSEGDPLFLARQRSVTFHNRKFIMASTPTVEGISRIWRAFEQSDQRYFYLPCPHCGEFHTLKWPQVQWDEGDPLSARMVCPVCGALYNDADKLRMLNAGEWRATQPFTGSAGFHISALYSPWQTFADVVKEWLAKKDHVETLKTFVNLQLGECWEDRTGEAVDHKLLMARREAWDSNEIPSDCVMLTAGVDVQDDRLEITVIGWTGTEQARVLEHLQLWGAPGEPQVWSELDNILLNPYHTHDGRQLKIRSCCIDSGGHHTARAYEFCRGRANRKVFPVKGRAGNHAIWPLRSSKSRLSQGVQLYLVGVDTAKDHLRSALAVKDPNKPRYVAFASTLHDAYFVQLTAEKRHTVINKSGMEVRTWKKAPGARNEATDCFVYALAALEALKQSGLRLRTIVRTTQAEPGESQIKTEVQAAMPPPLARKTARPVRRQSSALV